MNVYEMKEALVEICNNISPKGCMTDYCPLCEVCTSSPHIPKIMKDTEIITMYNETARQGIIKGGGGNNMTADQKRNALADACRNTPGYDCGVAINGDGSCPVCGVCTSFADTSDEMACKLYAEAVKRGVIKENNLWTQKL